jgi:hypothetical protein
MKYFYSFTLLLALSTALFAKSNYLPSGQNGTYIRADYTSNALNLFRLNAGYISKSDLNINAVFAFPGQIINNNDPDVRYAQTPVNGEAMAGIDLEYLLVKQQENRSPFNVSLNTSYRLGLNWYSSGIYLANNYLKIGCGISDRAKASERITLIPYFNVDLCRNISSYPSGYTGFGSYHSWNDYILFSFGMTVMMRKLFVFWDINTRDFQDVLTSPFGHSNVGVGIFISNHRSK